MPRRGILSPGQREALLVIPVDRAGLIEHYVLSEQDISLVRQRRGDYNRLGIAVQLALLRFPGTALQGDETPPKRLNKGEARNALARAVCFNRQGELRDRTFENQRYRASGLNLVVLAIILWNTIYLERAINALRQHGIAFPDALLR